MLKGKIRMMDHIQSYLTGTAKIASSLDCNEIAQMVDIIEGIRKKGGRLFFIGVGGSASSANHAVNDFRKIVHLESYAPTDNVAELTARTNDDGWDSTFSSWLRISRLNSKDGVFVFSVGGGNVEKNISPNIVSALKFAKEIGAKILGVVGRDGGFTKKVADACVVIPTTDPNLVTPHTEAFQAVILHLLVSHPKLKALEMKWESVK